MGRIERRVTDAGIAQSVVSFGPRNPCPTGVPSFLPAVTFIWSWNHHFVFAARRSARGLRSEWLH